MFNQPSNDLLNFKLSNRSILGNADCNFLYGTRTNDYINGGMGSDRLWGRAGNDTLIGGSGNDWLDGGSGNDTLKGGSGQDCLWGGHGDDRLEGGTGQDRLMGGNGSDVLIDVDGGDWLTGGDGSDQFWVGNGQQGRTIVMDFRANQDRLKFLQLGVTYNNLNIRDSQEGASITYQGQQLATLIGVKATSLTSNNFEFGNADLVNDLETALSQAIAAGLPGATVSIVAPDGTVWTGAAGTSDIANGTAMQANDRFYIGSITKPMTATVILQLVQEGVLKLEDAIAQWLPEPIASNISNSNQITIQQLLNHTSGLVNFTVGFSNDLLADQSLALQPWTTEKILQRYVYGKPLDFQPGQEFSYSNTGYLLLGQIIEAATSSPLAQQYQSRIFEPLGMSQTFFAPKEQIPDGTTRGYIDLNQDGKIDLNVDVDATVLDAFGFAGAAGGVVSNAADLSRFAQGLVGGELLTPETFDQMLNQGFPGTGYGLGLFNTPLANGSNLLGHNGSVWAWLSNMYSLKPQDITVVTIVNGNVAGSPDGALVQQVIDSTLQRYAMS
jgi:D-alanyl-D-alanine carboxypeptidase